MTGEDVPKPDPRGEWLGHLFEYDRASGTITFLDPGRGLTTIRPLGPELFDALDALNLRPPPELESM